MKASSIALRVRVSLDGEARVRVAEVLREHVDPPLVAFWNDFAPDPGRGPHHDPTEVEAQLVAQLDQPVKMLGGKAPKYTVWHCPVRAAPQDPILTDAEWADIARRIVAATGIAPEGDEEACRWLPSTTPTTTSTSPPPSYARTAAAPSATTTSGPSSVRPASSKSATD
ncbi:hypothetical protein HDA41_004662 [Streptomyces caelestis]|uniref:Uncharacterized protein n=1 Tax=Streptomyces caelestis TaxID=36816 RepID=A0A7W9H6L8_9ACTN|nr:hypothetical protein [Streptomyces caelestis]